MREELRCVCVCVNEVCEVTWCTFPSLEHLKWETANSPQEAKTMNSVHSTS